MTGGYGFWTAVLVFVVLRPLVFSFLGSSSPIHPDKPLLLKDETASGRQ
jgi:hypothetical protein